MKPLLLVVENDSSTRRLLDIFLRRASFEVDGVARGTDALTLLEHVDYAAVVLDLLIPGRTGRDVLDELAAHRPALLERIVVVSSATELQLRDVRGRYPSVGIVRKPFDLDELLAVIRARLASAPAPGPTDALQQFIRRSVIAGAKSGIVARHGGDALELVSRYGYAPGVAEQYFPIPADAHYPIAAAARHGRSVWISALNESTATEYPLLVSIWRERRSYALAVVPIFEGGRVAGVAGWSFAEPRVFQVDEQATLSSIAAEAASLLDGSPATTAASRGA